jgi:hypothetical protein
MDAGAKMAEAAAQFCALIQSLPPDDPDARCMELVAAICQAVTNVIRLDEVFTNDEPPEREPSLTYDEVRSHLKWLLLGLYHDIGAQCLDVSKEPEQLIGDVIDDLADIYRDLGCGIAHWTAGEREHAVWLWRESSRTHWQYHAAGALYALTHASRAAH